MLSVDLPLGRGDGDLLIVVGLPVADERVGVRGHLGEAEAVAALGRVTLDVNGGGVLALGGRERGGIVHGRAVDPTRT